MSDERIDELASIWCNWNAKQITCDEAMLKIDELFSEEINAKWRLRQKVRSEMMEAEE